MVFPLGFLLLFEPVLFQTRQRRCAWIGCVTFTPAFLVIQIHATLGTQAPAIATADRLHRQSQEDLLGQDIGQKHPFTLEKCDFGVVELQALLFFLGHGSERLIKQVKFPGNVLMDRFEAARADHFKAGMQFSGNTDLTFDEFSCGAHLEGFRLPEVPCAVVHSARGIALPDADLAYGQLFYV
jgi:hypothetical protein